MGFRRRTEDAETAEVEIEEVRRRVDAAQRTVEFEIIALIFLYKAAAHHNLEDISTQAVLYAAAYVRLVLLIGEGRGGFAHRVEMVRFHICLVHRLQQFVELSEVKSRDFFTFPLEAQMKLHRVVEMVEDDDVLIHDVIDVRRIILLHGGILDRDILKISHRIEGGESIESAEAPCSRPLHGRKG